MFAAEVRPLAQIRLAQNQRACLPQALDNERVARCDISFQRERTGGRLHPVMRVNVVFDKDGNAVERTTRFTGGPLLVEE